jgi:predicted transposase YbfD/YdcC
VRGAVVTIDAMGCQKAIAAQIIVQEADYILALKENHPTAHAQVVAYFEDAMGTPAVACSETTDGGHGRIEVRRVYTTNEIAWFEHRAGWEGLGCCIRVDCERTIANKTTNESHYFLSSLKAPDPAQVGAYIRGHWSVENPLHWSLDVSFHEDASRIRKDHGPENFALLRRIALVLLKNERTAKGGVPAKRLRAAWDPDYLLKVLAAGIPRNALEKG